SKTCLTTDLSLAALPLPFSSLTQSVIFLPSTYSITKKFLLLAINLGPTPALFAICKRFASLFISCLLESILRIFNATSFSQTLTVPQLQRIPCPRHGCCSRLSHPEMISW